MKHTVKIVLSLLLVTLFLATAVLTAAAEGITPTDPCGGKHDWDSGKLTTKRGCETKGVMTYTCRRCQKTKTQSLPALGHDWGEWEEAESHGKLVEKRTCRRCGMYETRPIETKVLDAMNDNPALSIELLSFNAPEIWLPGAKATGELKVTNTGDVWVIVTGYRICYEDGQFSFIDKLEDWPQGSAILPAGDSFTLSVSVVALSPEAAAKKIVRTFSVSGETFRENEQEHDPVTSNTVTGTAEEVILPAALSIELLSFSGPDTLVSGSEITGELKVTNTGEVWAVVTSYRVCDEDGQFCHLDKLEDWPQGSAILAVGDSFTLSVHVTALSSDADAGKVFRTFSVSGESLRENEKEHDAVTSNTVTGIYSCMPENDALALELLSFAGPAEIVSGAQVTGMLRATNTGDSILSISYGLMQDENGGSYTPGDKMGPYGADSVNMAPGASCDIPVSLTVSDKNILAGKVVRTFTLGALTVPQSDKQAVRKVTSNTVTGTLTFSEDVPAQYCSVSLSLENDLILVADVTHCHAHTETASQARALQAEGKPASELWMAEADRLYEQLLASVEKEEDRSVIEQERDAFRAVAEKKALQPSAQYPDDPMAADKALCRLAEVKCADLCRLVHGGSIPVPVLDPDMLPHIHDTDTDAQKIFMLVFSGDAWNEAAEVNCYPALLSVVKEKGDPTALDTAAQSLKSLWASGSSELDLARSVWADAYERLLSLYTDDPAAVDTGCLAMWLIAGSRFL